MARRFYRWQKSKGQSQADGLQITVEFSAERERLFKNALHIPPTLELCRVEAQDLSLNLFRKISHLLGIECMSRFRQEQGFFIYHPKRSRVVAIVPEKKKLKYLLIAGIRMRAMHPHVLDKLARIGYLSDQTAFLQPKVLEHEEYEHLIELLKKEMKIQEGG